MYKISMFDIALIAAGISCAVSLLIVYSQKWHGEHSLDHDLSGVQKFHLAAVPRIGGIAVVAGIILALGFSILLQPIGSLNLTGIVTLFVVSLPAFFSGMIEDLTKRVSVTVRLAATIASALLASWLLGATLLKINIWGVDYLMTMFPIAIVVTAVVVAGGANAINIIDGFNGLASSVVVIMTLALGYLAWRAGDIFIVELAMLGISATLGFLLVNYPTGKLFLGDGGAYFLGFWVAEIAVLLLVRNPTINAWQVLAICAYPIIEVMYSIYRRKFIQKTMPGAPDSLHMHTLIYSCVLPKILFLDNERPWLRNAAVTCIVTPCVAIFAVISVVGGDSVTSAGSIVIAQVLLYLAVYKRLVRGRSHNSVEVIRAAT